MIFSKNMIFLPHVVLSTLHVPEHETKGRQNGYFGFSFGDYRIYVTNHEPTTREKECQERGERENQPPWPSSTRIMIMIKYGE